MKFYKVMLNCFEEYRLLSLYILVLLPSLFHIVCVHRYLKNELRHMRVVCPEHTDGTKCPACPKV